MPTKDRGHLIGESVKSIIDQTFTDWELIVVDDQSSVDDKTSEVLAGFRDERIKYFRQNGDNGYGIAAGRNFGTAMAKGDYIAVADSDDLYYHDRLELSLKEFENGADVVYGHIDFWFPETGEIKRRDDEYTPRVFDPEYFKKYDFIPHPSVSYKRKIALDFPYNSYFKRAEDYDMLSRLYKFGFKFHFVDKPMVKYRKHADSVSAHKEDGVAYDQKVKENRGWA